MYPVSSVRNKNYDEAPALYWSAWETPSGALKTLYDNHAIDVITGLPSDYSYPNGAWAYAAYVTQEFNGSLFIGLSNIPMNGTGAIIVRLDRPSDTPVFEYNLPEEGVQGMCVDPAGTGLYIVGVDAHGPPELCGIYKRDLAGTWTKRATLAADWAHVIRMTWIGTRMFVAGQGTPNVAYSDDDGVTWTYPSSPGSINRVSSICALGTDLVAAGNAGANNTLPFQMYRSIDYGVNWTLLHSNAADGSSNDFKVWNGMVVGGIATNKLGTVDSGGTFTQVTVPFDLRKYYNNLVVMPDGSLCVLSTTGVWRTIDLVNWTRIWILMPGVDTGSNSALSMKSLGSLGNEVVVSSNGATASLRGRPASP